MNFSKMMKKQIKLAMKYYLKSEGTPEKAMHKFIKKDARWYGLSRKDNKVYCD